MFLMYPAQLALMYNAALLFSVTLNLPWAKSRAAGGQYDSFPLAIRALYFLMFLGMLVLMNFLWHNRNAKMSKAAVQFSRMLSYLFILSTIIQLLSKSSAEQFNAIPSAIIALTFLVLHRRNMNI